jgi:Tfp pilus assembly protein PilP
MRGIMTNRTTRLGAVAIALLGMLGASCGDDPPPAAAKPAAAKPATTAKTTAKKGKPGPQLQVYTKVEELVSDEEKKSIRRAFVENDYAPDSSGNLNRDPFRSYVIRQVGTGVTTTTTAKEEGDEKCSEKQLKATTYAVRALVLIGIVLRGAKSYALFRDTRGEGHTVMRNDCLGKEKARVTVIDAAFVKLELMPDASLNLTQRPVVEQTIKLHSKDLEVPLDDADAVEEVPPLVPLPPAEPSSPTPPPSGNGGGNTQ